MFRKGRIFIFLAREPYAYRISMDSYCQHEQYKPSYGPTLPWAWKVYSGCKVSLNRSSWTRLWCRPMEVDWWYRWSSPILSTYIGINTGKQKCHNDIAKYRYIIWFLLSRSWVRFSKWLIWTQGPLGLGSTSLITAELDILRTIGPRVVNEITRAYLVKFPSPNPPIYACPHLKQRFIYVKAPLDEQKTSTCSRRTPLQTIELRGQWLLH